MQTLLRTAAVAVIGAMLAAAPAAAQTLEKIKQRGVIVVGSKADYKPFGFRDPSGAIVGLEPDIAKLVADKLGVKLEIEPVVSSNRMQFLQQGGIQGAWYNKPVAEKYGADIVAFKGQTEAEVALQQGNCVGWVYDDTAFAERLADPKWSGFEMTLPTIMEEPWGLAVKLEEREGAWGKFMAAALEEWHRTGKLIELEKKWGIQASAFLKTMHEKYSKKGS
jgi:polar amino acid transport system substrate-binding protein